MEKIKNFAREVTFLTVIGTGLACLISYMVIADAYEKAKDKIRGTSVVKDRDTSITS